MSDDTMAHDRADCRARHESPYWDVPSFRCSSACDCCCHQAGKGIIVPGPGDLAAELARVDRTVLVTPPTMPYERVVVEHRDLTDPPTPPPDWAQP